MDSITINITENDTNVTVTVREAGDMLKSTYDPSAKEEQVLTVSDILDEDDMASDSATKVPSQQSVKAYVDANSGGSGDVTAASNITDNAIVRGDGGAKGVQSSGVTISDGNLVNIPDGGSLQKMATGGTAKILLYNSGNVAQLLGTDAFGSGSFGIDSNGTATLNEITIGRMVNGFGGRIYTASGFTDERAFNFPNKSGTVAMTSDITVTGVNGETGAVTLTEDDINGVRRTANVATTDSLDWNAYSVFELTMTGNTTFSDSNLPTGTNSKVIEIILSGNFTATLPAYWEADPNNDAYDGSVRNRLIVSCINGTSGSEDVIYTLTNLS